MDIPVELSARAQFGVMAWEEQRRETGGEDVVDEEVAGEGQDDLVGMFGHSGHVQVESPGLNNFTQPFRRRGKWVQHSGC